MRYGKTRNYCANCVRVVPRLSCVHGDRTLTLSKFYYSKEMYI